jgi:Melibiase/Glycosyl hydrolase family 36 C-terminal domain
LLVCASRPPLAGPSVVTRTWAAALGAALVAAPALCAQAPREDAARLASRDTSITIDTVAGAPRLAVLGRPGAPPWLNRAAEALPDHAEVGGVDEPLAWRLEHRSSSAGGTRMELVYATRGALRLRLRWRWSVRAPIGPIEHSVVIENLSRDTVWLPLQPSLRFDWAIGEQTALERFWVEKGADTPSAEGTHLDALRDGDTWQGNSSTYARPRTGAPREMIPFVLIGESSADGGGALRRGWYIGVEFSGRTHIALRRRGNSLSGEAGLDPEPGPYRTRLHPGETFVTPTVFVGAFAGGPDEAGNALRRWVRSVLGNPRTLADRSYPLLVTNSWGSGVAVDEALAQRMIVDAARLGLEMFHLDAGWFRAVGDWRADPAKFPHGIGAISELAHRHGMRFGLWVDWTQAGMANAPGALNVNDPTVRDWLVADPPPGWKPREPYKGITIDLGVPEAARWAARELERIVRDYRLDMLEHDGYLVAQGSARADHPAAPPAEPAHVYEDAGYLWAEGSNSTDVSYHATAAYYHIYEKLRARHPQLLLELCNDGGRMIDFGSAAHGDYFSVTDSYDPLSNRRAFFDASYLLPPAMLESYVAEWPVARLENFRYQLRSGMLGWFSLMLDTTRWTAEQQAAAHHEFALYKSALRPLIRTADLYHVSTRPDGVHWDGIEYYSPRSGRGVLYAFRGSGQDEPVHRFVLQGLTAHSRYALTFHDRTASGQIIRGGELLQTGVEVRLAQPLSSELVFLRRLPEQPPAPHARHTE